MTTKTAEKMFDEILFWKGRWSTQNGKIKEANYDGRIDDLRRFRLEMLADQQEKQGFWARVWAILNKIY